MDHIHHQPTLSSDHSPSSPSMGMVINWSYETSIVFDFWNTDDFYSMLVSCVIVVLISYSFEAYRSYRSKWDRALLVSSDAVMSPTVEGDEDEEANDNGDSMRLNTSIHVGARRNSLAAKGVSNSKTQLIRMGLHALEVSGAFFIMLIVMTMNGFLFISVVLGSAAGFYAYQTGPLASGKLSLACH